jgi:hypothetical protein
LSILRSKKRQLVILSAAKDLGIYFQTMLEYFAEFILSKANGHSMTSGQW